MRLFPDFFHTTILEVFEEISDCWRREGGSSEKLIVVGIGVLKILNENKILAQNVSVYFKFSCLILAWNTEKHVY